jgi:hypothetical protein
VAKGRAAVSQAGRILSRPGAIEMQMMTALEGTEWYLTFQGKTKGRQGGENVAEVGARAGRGIETERGIAGADARGHRLREKRFGGEVEAVIEIDAGLSDMTATDKPYWCGSLFPLCTVLNQML